MDFRDNDKTFDVAYSEVSATAYEVSAIDLARKEYGRQLAHDRLFQELSNAERDMILSEDITKLDPQRYYSLGDVATMLSSLDWVPDKLSDAALRYWFNADISALEDYVQPEKTGRRRLLPIISVLRMKLIAYWYYGKKYSIQQVNDIVFDVERATKKEWSPSVAPNLNDLQNMRIPPERMGEFMAWYTNTMLESFAQGFSPIEESVTKIQKMLGIVDKNHEDILNEQLQVMRQMWEITAKDELRTEALRLWMDSPNRFQKQLFGLVKTEDTTAKELYVADYINAHLAKKVSKLEDDYMARYRAKRAQLMEGR